MEEAIANGEGLTICGTVGTGKTYLLCIVGNEVVKQLGSDKVLRVDAHEFFNSLKPFAEEDRKERRVGYGTYLKEPRAIDRYNSVELLVIDDLGSEYHTDWAQVELDGVITSRHNERLSTCITTNVLDSDEFEEEYGARIADRLLERNWWYSLDGPSYRKQRGE